MEHISLRRAKELVFDVVDAAGDDFVYEKIPMYRTPSTLDSGECRYEQNGKPSCLVGHVLFRAGVESETLSYLDRVGVDAGQLCEQVSSWQDRDTRESVLLDMSREAARMLHKVQKMQDDGETWGECAEAARNWEGTDCE